MGSLGGGWEGKWEWLAVDVRDGEGSWCGRFLGFGRVEIGELGEDRSDSGAEVTEPDDFLGRDKLQDAFDERSGDVAGSIDFAVADYGVGG